jgi:hypothetical protein
VVVFGLPQAHAATTTDGPAPVGRGWRRVFQKVPALRKRVR